MGQGGRYCLRNQLPSSLPQTDHSLATDLTPWQKSIPLSFPISFKLKLQPQQASVIAAKEREVEKSCIFYHGSTEFPNLKLGVKDSKDHFIHMPCDTLKSPEQHPGKFPFISCLNISSDGTSAVGHNHEPSAMRKTVARNCIFCSSFNLPSPFINAAGFKFQSSLFSGSFF